MQRYALLYDKIDRYKAVSIMDCDMIPVMNDDDYIAFEKYIDEVMPTNSMSTNRSYYTWNTEQNLLLLEKYKADLKKNVEISYPIEGCDGLFKLYKFGGGDKIREFYDVWRYILLDSFKNKNHLISGSWNILIEEILSFVYKLVDIRVNSEEEHYRAMYGVKSFNFPEDRFWEDWTGRGFMTNVASKEEFIEKNYDKLKEYYSQQGLVF